MYEWHRDPTNKVLIFTKSVKLLDMLEFHLNRQRKEPFELHICLNLSGTCIDYGFVKLDGSTKQEDREHTQPVVVRGLDYFFTQACP